MSISHKVLNINYTYDFVIIKFVDILLKENIATAIATPSRS